MRDKIKTALRDLYGDFITPLESEYEEKMCEHLMNEEWDKKIEWATYNQVVYELKHTLKDDNKVKKLQYWLTDDYEDPRIICIEVIKEIKDRSPELSRLYDKIASFYY